MANPPDRGGRGDSDPPGPGGDVTGKSGNHSLEASEELLKLLRQISEKLARPNRTPLDCSQNICLKSQSGNGIGKLIVAKTGLVRN